MSELDDFRSGILSRQAEAEKEILLGDPEPRMKLWTRRDPVTVFGAAGPNRSGWDEVSRIFRWVASRFSDVTEFSYDIEVADVSEGMGYTVGYERFTESIDGRAVEQHTLRVTHVYRREEGEWKIVHRHADNLPPDQSSSRETPAS